MLAKFGATRTSIQRNHALLTPESFERITAPDWENAELIYVVTPQMGARFSMALVEAAGNGALPASRGRARFAFVLEGEAIVANGGAEESLGPESYVFLSPSSDATVRYRQGTRLVIHEWALIAEKKEIPRELVGRASDRPGAPLKGDERLTVQKLLPVDGAFDMEFNLMSFEPGASLPYVESHFMEHGLLFLDGGGVYRLDDRWYAVEAGDAIWMGPNSLQWFGALGRSRSRYLISKNYNRSPWAG